MMLWEMVEVYGSLFEGDFLIIGHEVEEWESSWGWHWGLRSNQSKVLREGLLFVWFVCILLTLRKNVYPVITNLIAIKTHPIIVLLPHESLRKHLVFKPCEVNFGIPFFPFKEIPIHLTFWIINIG